MLCEVLTVGGSASLWVGRLVGGDACGIVCRVLARESGRWLGCRVLGACAALRRGGVGPPFLSTWTFFGSAGYYTTGIDAGADGDGTILGDVAMAPYTVVFDRAEKRVGFAPVGAC